MLVMLMKMLLIKKICNVVLYSSEHEEITFLYVYFCVYLVIHWDDIVQTMLSNVVKEMGGGLGGHIGALHIAGVLKPAHDDIFSTDTQNTPLSLHQ